MKKFLKWAVGIFVGLIVLGFIVGEPEKSEEKAEDTAAKVVEQEVKSEGDADQAALEKIHSGEVKYYEKNNGRNLDFLFGAETNLAIKNAKQLATGFAVSKGVSEEFHDDFYRCLGDMTRTKNKDLEVSKVLGWCFQSYEADPEAFSAEQGKYSYFDLRKDFSSWDGSHKRSVEAIKSTMNDPSSFKHVDTSTRFANEDDGFFMYVKTKFSGLNTHGGRETNSLLLKIKPDTGEVVSFEVVQ